MVSKFLLKSLLTPRCHCAKNIALYRKYHEWRKLPSNSGPKIFGKNFVANSSIIHGKLGLSTKKIHRSTGNSVESQSQEEQSLDQIEFLVVPREKSQIISRFLMNYYWDYEPMTIALGLPFTEVKGWFNRFIRMNMFASLTDVSVTAIDAKEKRRVGVLASIVMDPAKDRPTLLTYENRQNRPMNNEMIEFYAKLDEGTGPTSMRNLNPIPKVLEHLYISVHPEYLNRGNIAGSMVKLSESLAKNINGCRIGYIVSTSHLSYKVFLEQGYKVVKEMNYADYVNSKGERIFEGKEDILKEHVSIKAMIKEFNDNYN